MSLAAALCAAVRHEFPPSSRRLVSLYMEIVHNSSHFSRVYQLIPECPAGAPAFAVHGRAELLAVFADDPTVSDGHSDEVDGEQGPGDSGGGIEQGRIESIFRGRVFVGGGLVTKNSRMAACPCVPLS